MEASQKFDVVIAGAGPAGLATALFLVKRRPELAGRIVAIEKSAHPRFKVCAGGLIPKTMLARAAVEAGVEIVQRSRVLDVTQDADGVRVSTDRGIFDAQILVGADGSGSRVRRAVCRA